MSEKKETFTDEQRRELDRMFSIVKERDEAIIDILERLQHQQKKGQYDDSIEKGLDRLRKKVE